MINSIWSIYSLSLTFHLPAENLCMSAPTADGQNEKDAQKHHGENGGLHRDSAVKYFVYQVCSGCEN